MTLDALPGVAACTVHCQHEPQPPSATLLPLCALQMQAEVLQQVEIEPQAAALMTAQSQAAVLRQQAAEAAMRAEIAQQAAVVLAEEASEVLTKAHAAKAHAEEVAAAGQDAHELQATADLWQSWQAQVCIA